MHDKYHPHTTSFPLKVFLLVQYYNYSSTVVGPRTSNIRTGGADNNPWNILYRVPTLILFVTASIPYL